MAQRESLLVSTARPRASRRLGGGATTRRRRLARVLRGERGVLFLLLLGVLALVASHLAAAILPRVLAAYRPGVCVPGSGLAPCPPEASRVDVDVVSVAAKPTCVTHVAVLALNQYVNPRRIVFVTSSASKCATLIAMASNV
eukprot:29888-Pelagococcus_subviridis.AAC.1